VTTESALEPLDRLVGKWATEVRHRAFPGVIVRGTTSIEWLEGERFLILRARTDHDDFPDSISIIGFTDVDRVAPNAHGSQAGSGSRLCMHYFDSRGVFRVYDTSVSADTWRISRDAPGFSQRFEGTFADGGDTIAGVWQLRESDDWKDDLSIAYRRQ
jgi:hypothetical protein